MTCIVAYDIEDDRIRQRLAKFLQGVGFRLQKSVFIVKVERHAFRRFLSDIQEITNNDGKVAIFRQCTGCQNKAIQLDAAEKFWYIF
jgi:CRISPR-associated endonuclease Cas2